MPAPTNSFDLRVSCANCQHQIDVNKYILRPPDDWPENRLHLVTHAETFVGTVRCPTCDHLTTYTRS